MRTTRRIIPVLVLCCFVLVGGCHRTPTSISLDRVAVVGASVTAGWGVKTPPIKGDFGAYPINLQHIMEAMIIDPHEEVAYFGEEMFFMHPTVQGTELIDEIIAHHPTVVIALDYLFWYGYGNIDGGEAARLAKFELGLGQLGRIDAPIIVGNMPDMHEAVGRVLKLEQVPTPQTIAKMNARLRQWAFTRPNISVINVHNIVEHLLADRKIVLPSHVWEAGSRSKLLQNDLLHPTLEGTVALSLLIAESIGIDGLQDDPAILMKHAAEIARAHEN